MFAVDASDVNGARNGDVTVRTDKGTLVALVYASGQTVDRAEVIAAALNAAFSPGHTDLMVTPESLDAWLEQNPLPPDIHPDQTSPMTVGAEEWLGEAERLRRELSVEREITANLIWAVERATDNTAFVAAAEQMIAHEEGGGNGWWKGFEMLKAAYEAAIAEFPKSKAR